MSKGATIPKVMTMTNQQVEAGRGMTILTSREDLDFYDLYSMSRASKNDTIGYADLFTNITF